MSNVCGQRRLWLGLLAPTRPATQPGPRGAWVVALVLPGLLLGCGPEQAAPPERGAAQVGEDGPLVKRAEKGPAALVVTVTPRKPRLSDAVELNIEVRAHAEVDVKAPAFGEAVSGFTILDYRERPPRVEEGKTVRTFWYKLEPPHAGRHLIRALAVSFIDRRKGSEAEGRSVQLETEPIEVEVSSAFGDGPPDLARLEPMLGPQALPAGPLSTALWIVLGAVALGAAGALYFFLRRREVDAVREPQRSPEEIAYRELEALRDSRLAELGRIVDFYVELTAIVRRYIERTTGIRAPEQTTEEFLRAMRQDDRFDRQKAKRLETFLEASDLVKYAALRPAVADLEDAFAKASEFVCGAGGRGLLAVSQPLAESGKPPARG